MASGKRGELSKADGVAKRRKEKLSTRSSIAAKSKPNSKKKKRATKTIITPKTSAKEIYSLQAATASQQLHFFLQQYQSANRIQLSSLELESITETCILNLSESLSQDASTLGEHMKISFGPSWKQMLCEKQLPDGKSEPGCPALLTISSSALRSLELLRGLRPLTRECRAAKLFSKHMKVEDQVSLLRQHINIACGTPSRIKRLIDVEALGLSQLAVVVLDMHTDAKGFSLLTLPQVRDEFWDLYRSYFHRRLLQGNLRICLYGSLPTIAQVKDKVADVHGR